jgi:hypothetical protein
VRSVAGPKWPVLPVDKWPLLTRPPRVSRIESLRELHGDLQHLVERQRTA